MVQRNEFYEKLKRMPTPPLEEFISRSTINDEEVCSGFCKLGYYSRMESLPKSDPERKAWEAQVKKKNQYDAAGMPFPTKRDIHGPTKRPKLPMETPFPFPGRFRNTNKTAVENGLTSDGGGGNLDDDADTLMAEEEVKTSKKPKSIKKDKAGVLGSGVKKTPSKVSTKKSSKALQKAIVEQLVGDEDGEDVEDGKDDENDAVEGVEGGAFL
ncbi:unnamed protein product [Zymoseptoria tritici ST99CH_1A5]|uniref:Uncharacterized protein n=1 Tax=Zymoseptoria tritici ST99CH_1A5 TaxID=1276529 RepID=A0A1Y6LKN7_ZYMTR|nr:unnamed protein product [Zymoseptoria tritici ST99CH_1A5]